MSESLTLHKKLVDIQKRLKVPKDIDNDFGGFKYRNIEEIEDKLKPLLNEHGLVLTFDDEPVEVGGRVYIKSTAKLSDGESAITASAYAREATSPKAKMDDSQLTGSCSSYARKYAAGGLFLIDNTKDADSDETPPASITSVKKTEWKPSANKLARDVQKEQIVNLLRQRGINDVDVPEYLASEFGIIGKLNEADAVHVLEHLQAEAKELQPA